MINPFKPLAEIISNILNKFQPLIGFLLLAAAIAALISLIISTILVKSGG